MTSLLQAGFGMFSARVGRSRPRDAEKRFLINLLLTILCVSGWATGLQADPAAPTLSDYRATYEREQNKIRSNNAAVLAADADYLKALERLQADFKKKGDFDNTMAVTAERKRFETTHMVPEHAPYNLPPAISKVQSDYRAALTRAEATREQLIARLNTTYVKVLKDLIKKLLNDDKMAEAEVVNKEMKLVEADLVRKGGTPGPLSSSSAFVTTTGGVSTNYTLDDKHYTAWIFHHSGTFTVAGGSLVCDVLVVAGGGAGGGYVGGGGGAGGLVYSSGLVVSGVNPVNVGAGGVSSNGEKSIFGSIKAMGGGQGSIGGGSRENCFASVGGSGGGGASSYDAYPLGANGISGQGNAGGDSPGMGGYFPSAGGGGAGSAGGSPANSTAPGGNGGNGLAFDISGSTVYYAGGGGGGSQDTTTAGKGGMGGGGNGSRHSLKGRTTTAGTPGTANTGGGGGGGGTLAKPDARFPGGSGIVIVRYQSLD